MFKEKMPYERISKRKGYSGKQKKGLGLHMGLQSVGLRVSTTIPLDKHFELVMSLGMLFEGEKHVNKLGRWTAMNMAMYMSHKTPKDVVIAYLVADTSFNAEELNGFFEVINDEFYVPFYIALTGLPTRYLTTDGSPRQKHQVKTLLENLKPSARYMKNATHALMDEARERSGKTGDIEILLVLDSGIKLICLRPEVRENPDA